MSEGRRRGLDRRRCYGVYLLDMTGSADHRRIIPYDRRAPGRWERDEVREHYLQLIQREQDEAAEEKA